MRSTALSRSLLLLLLVIGSSVVVHAFVVSRNIGHTTTTTSRPSAFGTETPETEHPVADNQQQQQHDFAKAFRNWFGAVAITSMIALHPFALPASAISPEASSSFHVAETIKVLDTGLPSYGDISDVKASVETVEGLAKEEAMPVKERKARAPKEPKSGSGGGPMSALLPSLGKKGPKMTEEQKAKQEAIQRKKDEMKAELQAKKEAQAQERKEAQEAQAQERKEAQEAAQAERAEKAAIRAQEREEKAALKEQERAEKAALREQAKEEKKQEAMFEVVDMGLPSYSDSTAAKEKSVFSF